MSSLFILLTMFFFHIIDDYKLQSGILVNLKQKKYWKENAPEAKYKFDYIVGLIMHSFSWTFMIMLPVALSMSFNIRVSFVVVLVINMIVHAVVDDLKANKFKINLIVDQTIHIIQIIITWIIFAK